MAQAIRVLASTSNWDLNSVMFMGWLRESTRNFQGQDPLILALHLKITVEALIAEEDAENSPEARQEQKLAWEKEQAAWEAYKKTRQPERMQKFWKSQKLAQGLDNPFEGRDPTSCQTIAKHEGGRLFRLRRFSITVRIRKVEIVCFLTGF